MESQWKVRGSVFVASGISLKNVRGLLLARGVHFNIALNEFAVLLLLCADLLLLLLLGCARPAGEWCSRQ